MAKTCKQCFVKMGFERCLQQALDRLGIPLKATWAPNASVDKHGEIVGGVLRVYDENEPEAWLTFMHEVYEYKFKEVTQVYLALVNSLIESFEKIAYERKERFLESLPRMHQILAEHARNVTSTSSASIDRA